MCLIRRVCAGKTVPCIGTLILYKTERLSLGTLLALYVIQYAGILVLFLIKRHREPRRDISKELSLRKWGSYQRADLIQALISHSNVDNDNVRQRSAYSVDLLFVINLYFV